MFFLRPRVFIQMSCQIIELFHGTESYMFDFIFMRCVVLIVFSLSLTANRNGCLIFCYICTINDGTYNTDLKYYTTLRSWYPDSVGVGRWRKMNELEDNATYGGKSGVLTDFDA